MDLPYLITVYSPLVLSIRGITFDKKFRVVFFFNWSVPTLSPQEVLVAMKDKNNEQSYQLEQTDTFGTGTEKLIEPLPFVFWKNDLVLNLCIKN